MFLGAYLNKGFVEKTLGSYRYKVCHDFFKDFLLSSCYYKIIMTRRCFSLFRVFYPILQDEGVKNTDGTQIITDKAVPLHMDEIAVVLRNRQSTGILIIDDVIIFGRTINAMLDSIIVPNLQMGDKEDILPLIQVRSIVQSVENSLIKDEYSHLVLAQRKSYNYDWRVWSARLSKLLSKSTVASTSYVVSAMVQDKLDLSWFDDVDSERHVNIQWVTVKNDDIAQFIKGAFIRTYRYSDELKVITPLVILNDISLDDMNLLCNHISNKLCDKLGSEMSKLFQTSEIIKQQARLQLVTLLLSHSILQHFFHKNELSYSYDKTDCAEIITYNFSSTIYEEFLEIENSLYSLLEVELEISKNDDRQESVDIKVLTCSMADVSGCKSKAYDERHDWFPIADICESKYVYSIVRLIDSGRASIKTSLSKNNKLCSLLYSGEQAFMIGVDLFLDSIDYFRYAEYLFGKPKFDELNTEVKLNLHLKVLDILIDKQVVEASQRNTYSEILNALNENRLGLEYIVYDDLSEGNCHMQETIKTSIKKEVQSFVNISRDF